MRERVRQLWRWTQLQRPMRAFSHFTDVGGSVLSAGMSYQAVFAVFAALWVGFGIFGVWLSGRESLLHTLVEQINTMVPGLVGSDGLISVSMLLSVRSLSWTSIVAGVSLLWVTLAWFTGTRRAIRIIFGLEVKQYRNAVVLKLLDFVIAIVFMVALIMSAVLTLLSSSLAEWLLHLFDAGSDNWLLTSLGTVVRYAALYVFDVLLLLAIFYVLAEIRVPSRALLAGCLLGAVVLDVLKVLGTALLGGASSNPLLASFAVFIGLLIWFNLVCRTLLLTAAWVATGQNLTLGVAPATAANRVN